jgi:Putative peptidoglycan binding domain/NlpC/P60 family
MTLPLSKTQHSRDPQPAPAVIDAQWWLTRKSGMTVALDGEFGNQTDEATRRFQRKAGLAVNGVIDARTYHQLSFSHGSEGITRGLQVRALAYKIATGGYIGRPLDYEFGAENNLFHPERCTQTDCSELVQMVVTKLTGSVWLDGSWVQYGGCRKIPVSEAMGKPGALVFHTKTGQPSGIHHVAVCYGNGKHTIEARSEFTDPEVGVFDGRRRFNLAGLIPGVRY